MRTLLTNAMLLMYVGVILLGWAVYYRFIKKETIKGNEAFKLGVRVSIGVMFINHIVSLLRQNLMMLQCRNIYHTEAPEYYLIQDYDVKCWEDQHFYWAFGLAAPVLLVLCFIIPYSIIKKITKNSLKGQYKDISILLSADLKPKYLHWEGV